MTPTTEQPKLRIYHVRVDDKPEALIHADVICTQVDHNGRAHATLKREGEKVGTFSGRTIDWWIEETD